VRSPEGEGEVSFEWAEATMAGANVRRDGMGSPGPPDDALKKP